MPLLFEVTKLNKVRNGTGQARRMATNKTGKRVTPSPTALPIATHAIMSSNRAKHTEVQPC